MAKYGLEFDLVETPRQQRQLGRFLMQHVGKYSAQKHQQWVEQVCMPGIVRDDRRAVAWWEHGRMVGDAVLKPLGANRLELKNFRIEPGSAGKHLASVMMSHVFLEGRDLLREKGLLDGTQPDFSIQLDTSPALALYFGGQGFEPVATAELYTPGQPEVIMQRTVALH